MTLDISQYKECHEFAKKTVAFLKYTTACSAAVFTWHDGATSQPAFVQSGGDDRMIYDYYQRYHENDPLKAERLIRSAARVTTMSSAFDGYDPILLEQYKPFLKKYNLMDEVDFLFWAGGTPIASAALLHIGGPECQLSSVQLAEIQSYLQYTLSIVPTVRKVNRRHDLSAIYKMTKKEQSVAQLLVAGESNSSIAAHLGVELATIKTHVVHIFQKLEVNSRSKAIAMLMDS